MVSLTLFLNTSEHGECVSFLHFCVPVAGIKDSLGREGEVVLTDMFSLSGVLLPWC